MKNFYKSNQFREALKPLAMLILFLAMAINANVWAQTSYVNTLGVSSGWYSDDTRTTAGVTLNGLVSSYPPYFGGTPGTVVDDAAIAAQISFGTMYSGSSGNFGVMQLDGTTANAGKSSVKYYNSSGIAPGTALASFTSTYRWYMEPYSTTRTVGLSLMVVGSNSVVYSLAYVGEGAVINSWNTFTVNASTTPTLAGYGWFIYGTGAPGATQSQSLNAWLSDPTWGPILSGGTIVAQGFNIGSYQRNCRVGIDWLESSILNGGNRIDFVSQIPTVHNTTQNTYYLSIQAAIDAATAGDFINVAAGTFYEGSGATIKQVIISKDLNIIGAGNTLTIIKPNGNTGSTGNDRGWFLVDGPYTVNFSKLAFDGAGNNIFQAIRHKGGGTIDECMFKNIKHSQYYGIAIAAPGVVAGKPLNVTNSVFENIERVGFNTFNNGSFIGNTYTGKGTGDFVDYAVDMGGNANLIISNNTISNNLGVASSDGSGSAGLIVSSYYTGVFSPPTPLPTASVTDNNLFNNSVGLYVGYDASDLSIVSAHGNSITGNTIAIRSTNPVVEATCNWYGTALLADITPKISGNVTYLPYNTTASGPCDGVGPIVNNTQGTSYTTIQAAVNGANSNDVINIASGTYTGDIDLVTGGKDITLSPGSSPGCVTINGNMSYNTGDALAMEINGTTACTLYDQFIVNGTVTLGGATLNLTVGYTPVNGDQYTLISNDGTDAITGQFAQGILITDIVTGNSFSINYSGGDGNDVVLTACGAGTVHNISHTPNWNYCSIQDAINAAVAGDIINVDAGTFIENVVVNKELELRGANYNVNPNTGVRGPESILMTAIIEVGGSNNSRIVAIDANNVTIKGFLLDGNNPALTSGFLNNVGADMDIRNGIDNAKGIQNLRVENNILKNMVYYGIRIQNTTGLSPAVSSGHEIHNNRFMDMGTYQTVPSGWGLFGGGVLLQNSHYAKITNNVMLNVRTGVQTGNFQVANPTSFVQTIADNEIQARKTGIMYNLHRYSPWLIEDNQITGYNSTDEQAIPNNTWYGLRLLSLGNAMGTSNFVNNIIDGSAVTLIPTVGATIWNVLANSLVSISEGNISGVTTGIFINNFEGYNANASDGANATINNVSINASQYGVRLLDSPNSTSHTAVQATITNCSITNGVDGILLNETSGAKVSCTANNNSITGQSGKAINSGVSNQTSATCNWYGTTDAIAITAKISGNVAFLPYWTTSTGPCDGVGPVVVYEGSTTTVRSSHITIQAGINAAIDGDVIEVSTGTYNEQVLVTKAVKILGVGVTQPIIDFTGTVSGKPTLFDVLVDGVSIENLNFKVDLAKLRSAIIASAAGIDNITVKNNIIDCYGTPAGSYGERNAVSVNYAGYRVASGGVDNITFTGNTVNAGTYPTMFRSGISVDEGEGTFSGNTLTTISADILVRFAASGNVTVNGNHANGGGMEFADFNAGSGTLSITGNFFDGTFANTYSNALRLKNNYTARTTVVSGNTFTGFVGITGAGGTLSLENYQAITVDNNTFTPLAGSTSYRHITLNTKDFSSSSGSYAPVVGATFTKNTFYGSGTLGGIAIGFYNWDNDSPTFNTITIGTPGNENIFNDNIGTFIYLDNSTGTVSPNATAMVPWAVDLNAQNNKFSLSPAILPSAMTLAELFTLEDMIQHKIDDTKLGFVTVKASNAYVTDMASATAINNDYTRIRNAVELVDDNWTINLHGTFDWTETNAAASWTLGNDGISGNDDDYTVLVPADLTGITFTAPEGLGFATIQGPGDLPGANLEGTLNFWLGNNQDWTISNLNIFDFDLSIGMFYTNVTDFNNTLITNNHFRIPKDLNKLDAPLDVNQNIGIHYAFGTNQTISNNIFDVEGDGVSNGTNYSTSIVMQSNTSGGAVYDGLKIKDNTITVTGVPASDPSVIRGIWENGANSDAAIEISGNIFTNANPANTADLNRQLAFWVTSFSSATKKVEYKNNEVSGFNEGVAWIGGLYTSYTPPAYQSGQYPVEIKNNKFDGMKNAIVVRKAVASTNTGSPALINNNSFVNFVSAGLAVKNEGTGDAVSTCNWWETTIPAAIAAKISGTVTNIPWLTDGIDLLPSTSGFQPSVPCAACAITLEETHIDLACPSVNNGSIDLTVNDAVLPVTYIWSGPGSFSSSDEDITGLAVGTYSVTVTADNGCTQTTSVIIGLSDEPAPVITPSSGSTTVACISAITIPTPPAGFDHCGTSIAPVLVSTVDSPDPLTCEGTRTYTYAYTDYQSKTTNWVYTTTVENLPFTAITPTSATVACYGSIVMPTLPVVKDNCNNTLTPTGPIESTPPACEGDVTYTWTYTDCEGNTQLYVHTVTIEREDFTMPVNGKSTVACTTLAVPPVLPIITDNCGNTITPTPTVPEIFINYVDCEGQIMYLYHYYDCEGNTHDWAYTYTIEREPFTDPIDAGTTVACASLAVTPTLPVVTDNCGAILTPTGPTMGGTYTNCEGTITYTYLYTDCEGNMHDWVYTYTIEHEDFNMPANTTTTISCIADLVVPTPPVVTDNCGNTITPVAGNTPIAPVCEGDMVYSWTYTDCEGNSHVWTHTVTIEYEDFSMPANTTATIACKADLVVPTPPTVSDKCGNTINPVAGTTPIAPACEGNMVYSWTYTDCEGNSHVWTHTVTIEYEDFNMPANTTATIACIADLVVPTPPVVTDNCGNTITPVAGNTPIAPVCEGDMVYSWTYTDCEGNSHVWTHTVTIEREDFTMPANGSSTVTCIAAATPPTPPIITDYCSNPLTPPAAVIVDTYNGCEGTRTYTFTYTDCELNTHDWVYTYTIESEDFTMPANTTATIACIADLVVPTPPVVTDNCGNTITPVAGITPIAPACEGEMVYSWTYTDCEGNSHVWTHTVTIERLPFAIITPTSATAACYGSIVMPTLPVVKDNCNNILTPTGPVEGTIPTCEGDVTYTWTYVDCEGNTQLYVHTVTIESEDFNMPLNTTATIACIADLVVPTPPVVTDNCGNTITPVAGITPIAPACEGEMVYSWTYTDCEGNSHVWTHTVTIERLPFAIITPTSATAACYGSIVMPTLPVVKDNCNNILTPTGPVEGTIPTCEGDVTYTWTYVDCEGNTQLYVHTVTIESEDFNMPLNTTATIACIADLVVPTPPVVTDNCGNTITPVAGITPIAPACEGEMVYSWTYTDCEGNSHVWTHTVTIERLPFAIITPTSATAACYGSIVMPTLPTLTDNCGGTITNITGPVISTPPTCEGNITYTWTYTDCGGNTQPYVHTVTIEQEDFNMPANTTATIACIADLVVPTPPVVTDNCGNTITPVAGITPIAPACEGEMVYSWTYTDCEGNSHVWTHTVTIERLPFAIITPTSATAACYGSIVMPTLPVVKDNCNNILTPTGPVEGTIPTCEGDVTYTWTYVDCEGNTQLYVHTVTIESEDFNMPLNTTATIACIADLVVPTPPVVTDNCGNTITPVAGITPIAPACEGEMVYSWTYTDCEGNSHVWTHTVTIERLPFAIITPTSATAACYGSIVMPTLPIVKDNCNNILTPTGPVEGTIPTCEGDVTYTWTYVDCEGNTQLYVHTVTIESEDFNMPLNTTATIACIADLVVPTPPVVTDNCGNTITPVAGITPIAPACEGEMVYSWTYTDCEGNSHVWTHTVTIERLPFAIITPTSATAACYGSIVMPTLPTLTDNCGGTITNITGPVISTPPTCEGNITYTWTYTDCGGNTQPYVHTVTIEREDFNMPANAGSTVTCIAAAIQPTPPTVTDNCGNAITPSVAVIDGTYNGCEGTRTYTFTYTDCEGNTHNWVYTYTIERIDFTMPVNGVLTVACAAQAIPPTLLTITDNCGNILTPTGPIIFQTYVNCEGKIAYHYNYADCEGNNHDWVFTYTIERQPFIDPTNAGTTVTCIALAVTPTLPVVTDNCGTILTPTGPTMGGTYTSCEGTKTYTYLYTDCEGNTNDWVYTYTIESEDFNMPLNTTATIACIADLVVPTPPVVTDNCGNTITPVAGITPIAPACEGEMVYSWTYTDCEGNSHVWTHTVTIERLPFAIITPTSATAACYGSIVMPTLPVVKDNCNNILTPTGPVEGTIPTCEGDVTYTWTYVDCEGNTQLYVHTVTIESEDFNMPLNTTATIACIADLVVPTPPVVTDNCGNTITPVAGITPIAPACEGEMVYSWTYTDCEGNSHVWTHTVTIERLPFATITPTSATAACYGSIVMPTLPVVKDNCNNILTPTGPVEGTIPTCEGDVTYTWTYVDCEGNTQLYVHTVTIESEDFNMPLNTTATIACIADLVVPTPPVVTDNCGNTITPVAGITPIAPACEGEMVYSWTYTDCEGNSHVWTHTVTIERLPFAIITPTSATAACYGSIVMPTLPVVKDNCNNILTPTGPVEGTIPTCEGDVTYTWTYVDCEGNTQLYVHTVTIESEDFNMPLNTTATIACIADLVVPTPPVVTDNCGNTITPVAGITPIAPACEGEMVYSWTYTDCEGNSHVWTHTVTIERLPFAIITPTSATAACYGSIVMPTLPVVKDNCNNILTPTGPVEGTIPTCEGDVTYTWTYVDCEGNTQLYVHTVTIESEDFNMPLNTTATIACIADLVVPTPPVVTDNCGNTITPVAGITPIIPACEGEMVYSWTYTDCEGNSHVWTHTVTIERLPFATITPTSATAACYGSIVMPTLPVVKDNCNNILTPTGPVEGTIPTCEGDVTYTWTYVDCEGNTQLYVHTVTIESEDFNMPLNTTATIACIADLVVPTPPVVMDNCGNTITPVAGITPIAPACEGEMVYSWTYTDCEGNSHVWTHTVTIERNTAPILPANGAITVACMGLVTTPTTPSGIVDQCGTIVPPVFIARVDIPATLTTQGSSTFSYSYTDCSGYISIWKFVYTIQQIIEPVPTITGPTTACKNSTGNVYTTEAGMTNYIWNVSAGGTITSIVTPTSNSITVTWNTAGQQTVSVNYTLSGCFTAANPTSSNVTVNNPVIPIFNNFGPYVMGSTPGVLPLTSNNGISGTWSPATISTAIVGSFVYTFTPNAGPCASVVTKTVNITGVTSNFFFTQDIGTTLQIVCPQIPTATLYYVKYTTNPNGQWATKVGANNFVKITNLTPGTLYYWKLDAYNATGNKIATLSQEEYTTETLILDVFQDVGATCLVSWNDYSTWASSYVVRYKIGSGSWVSNTSMINERKLTGLTPGQLVEFKVDVYKSGNLWGTTGSAFCTSKPVTFTSTNVSSTGLTLSWSNFDNDLASWVTYSVVYYRPQNSTGSWSSKVVFNSASTTTLTGLTAGVTYNCYVIPYYQDPFIVWGPTNLGTFTVGTKQSAGNTNVSVYPNPFVNEIHVALFTETETDVNWNIYDITGKVVLSGSESIASGYSTLKIEAGNLPKGVYMLNAMINNEMQSIRIMKQ